MNPPLPAWIERLVGIQTGPGEGTAWSLEHTWNWPPWLTLVFAVAAVAFIVGTYLRESSQASRPFRLLLASIRLALVAIVLFMLAQFAMALHRTGLPYVAVIVDDSLSMTVVDRYDEQIQNRLDERLNRIGATEPSRWNLARVLLTEREGELLRRIRDDYRLRFYYLTGPRPTEAADAQRLVEEISSQEPVGEQTRLGGAVRTVLEDLRGTTPAAIVLVSDGVNTDGPALAEAATDARRRGVPIFTVALGDDQPVRDLKLSDLLVEDVVFVEDVVTFEARLTAAGYSGREVTVVLREEGESNVLARTKVTLGPNGQPQTVRLAHRPKQQGEFHFVMEAEPLKDELDTENNRQKRMVRVSDKQIQVLLVGGYPNFEFRYLWNMLTRDSTINVQAVLQQADPEMVLGDAGADDKRQALYAFPVRREELFQYDVIILGDVDPGLLSASIMENLEKFVDDPGKGGALVLIAGPQHMPSGFRGTPLERLLPVELESVRYPNPNQAQSDGFQVEPTDLGLASPQMQLGDTLAETRAIWENLPPLYWMVEAGKSKPGARELAVNPERTDAEGRPLPVICIQYVGAGKVLFHATDETHRWRYRVGDVFFARYWIQTIRYLSRSKLSDGGRSAVLATDRREYLRGQPVQLRLRFADERLAPADDRGVTVVVEHEGHGTRRIELARTPIGRGVFEGLVNNPAIGSYHAWVAVPTLEGGAPTADFVVTAPPGEFDRTQADTSVLKRAAEQTKGRFYTFHDAQRLPDELPQGRQVPVETLPSHPLWNTWPVLVLFLFLLVSEWILRKVGGML